LDYLFTAPTSGTIIIIGLLIYGTYLRNEVWSDWIRLWVDCAKKSPEKARPYNNVGTEMLRLKMYDEAVPWIATALSKLRGERDETYAMAHSNFGLLLARVGRFDEAIGHLELAKKKYPYSPEIRSNLGIYYASVGRKEEAIAELKEAVRINPYFKLAKENLDRVMNGNTNRTP
jgi:protein O-mannosyl-transferase